MFLVYRHRMECLAWKGSPCFNNANACLPISGDNEDFPPLFFLGKGTVERKYPASTSSHGAFCSCMLVNISTTSPDFWTINRTQSPHETGICQLFIMKSYQHEVNFSYSHGYIWEFPAKHGSFLFVSQQPNRWVSTYETVKKRPALIRIPQIPNRKLEHFFSGIWLQGISGSLEKTTKHLLLIQTKLITFLMFTKQKLSGRWEFGEDLEKHFRLGERFWNTNVDFIERPPMPRQWRGLLW